MLQLVKLKAEKYWLTYSLHLAFIENVDVFPLQFTLKKISGHDLAQNFDNVRNKIRKLHDSSKVIKNKGYDIIYDDVSYQSFGQQKIPVLINFASEEDFLYFVNKSEEFNYYKNIIFLIKSELPMLLPWVSTNFSKLVKSLYLFPRLINICKYFIKNPKPDLYIRQLDIKDIDSKFIEQHKKLLSELLHIIISADCINTNIRFNNNVFEKTFHLKYDQPAVRFRFLDPAINNNYGLSDITVPLDQFSNNPINCTKVFITENKINGLCFPEQLSSIIIFGMGFKINLLAEVPWLSTKEIIYWGDIDSYGFVILSRLREYLPHVKSFLMDEQTLLAHKYLWGTEDVDKKCTNFLANLTAAERELYEKICYDYYSPCLRLEQERIGYNWMCEKLAVDQL